MKKILVLLVLLISAVPTATAHARGSLDRSFGAGGRVVRAAPSLASYGPTQVAQGPDGTIYALFAGSLVAFKPNGESDASFGSSGVLQLAGQLPSMSGSRLTLDREGRLILAGSTTVEAGTYQNPVIGQQALMVARFLPTGALDPSFGNAGTLVTDLSLPEAKPPSGAPPFVRGGVSILARAAAVDQMDRIVVTGIHATQYVATKMGLAATYAPLAARIDSNGAVDGGYGTNGAVGNLALTNLAGSALAPDGSVYLAGFGGNPVRDQIVHLDANGSLDSRFGRGHMPSAPADEEAKMVVDGRGRLTVCAWSPQRPHPELLIQRFRRDGHLARGFGDSGRLRIRFGSGTVQLKAMAGDRNGGLFVATGWERGAGSQGGAKEGFTLAHVTREGRVDRRFGRLRTGFGADTQALPESILVEPRGRPLLAGSIASPLLADRFGLAMARYLP